MVKQRPGKKKRRFLASHLSEAVVSQVCNKLKAGQTIDACRRTGMKRLLIILLNQIEDVIPCWGKKKKSLFNFTMSKSFSTCITGYTALF